VLMDSELIRGGKVNNRKKSELNYPGGMDEDQLHALLWVQRVTLVLAMSAVSHLHSVGIAVSACADGRAYREAPQREHMTVRWEVTPYESVCKAHPDSYRRDYRMYRSQLREIAGAGRGVGGGDTQTWKR
jgi:hypothetical protein